MSKPSLWAIPLGGLGEFGMNMLALRTGNDIVVIDAGMMFPEVELLGVDIVIPDITYLKQNREHVRAIVLTHGHEDHIGALPYILRDLNVPVFGTRFTLALVRKRLEEHGLLEKADLREVRPGRHAEMDCNQPEAVATRAAEHRKEVPLYQPLVIGAGRGLPHRKHWGQQFGLASKQKPTSSPR